MMLFSQGLLAAGALAALSALVSSAPAASTYIVDDGKGLNMTFSLNVPKDSNDIYFHMSGPTGNDYIAFGIGSDMKNSLIFVVYASSSTGITLSPRLATGNFEPSYTDAVQCDLLPDTRITNDTYIVNARCRNSRSWKDGSLDVDSNAQPFIYAAGPNNDFQSTSMSANLRRHQFFGKFTMDIIQATGDAGVPTVTNKTTGATDVGSRTDDHNYAVGFHALLMVGVFVFIFPIGAMFRVIFSRVIWHWLLQSLGFMAAGLAVILGIYISRFYNKSNKYNTAHQIIGLLVILYLVAQVVMGIVHHRRFTKTKMKTTLTKVHSIGGRIIMILGVVNGSLGFGLADDRKYIIPYVILIVAVTIFTVGIQYCVNRRRVRKAVYDNPHADNFRQEWTAQQNQAGIHLSNAPPPSNTDAAPPPYMQRP